MSAERIDVLAVLDRAAAAMQFERDDHKYHRQDIAGWWDRLLIDTNEARAAVAELIETGEPVAQKMEQEDYPEWPDDARVEVVLTLGEMRRFRAALARIGAKP